MTPDLVLGVVFTLAPGAAAQARERLAREPHLSLGALEAHKLPAVLETCVGEDEARMLALSRIEGVLGVDVVYAHIEPFDPQRTRA